MPRLNYVQKITTLVVVKRTHTNTLARTCRKHNKSGVTINWVHFVFFRQVAGGVTLRAKTMVDSVSFAPHPLPRPYQRFFFLSRSSFSNSHIFTGKTLGMWSSQTRTRAPVSSRLRTAEPSRVKVHNHQSGFTPLLRLISSRRKLVAAIVFDPSYQKATVHAVVTKRKSKSVIVVWRRHLNVEVYTCYNKRWWCHVVNLTLVTRWLKWKRKRKKKGTLGTFCTRVVSPLRANPQLTRI